MAVQVRLQLETLCRALQAVQGKLKDQNALLRAAGRILVNSTVERFSTGIAPDGTPWKPSERAKLADDDIKAGNTKAKLSKPRAGSVARPAELGDPKFSGKTLVETGQLRNSISMQVKGGVLLVGSTVPYAATHQLSAVIRAKNKPYLKFKLPGGSWISTKKVIIPKRPFLGVSARDVVEVEEEIVALLGNTRRSA
ncbi:MAG: hypothetical protein E6R12_08620 [Sphingomonadales bacterium]|nr:MAG: hypothetical protein E6R12_08620 [Sphingomonadales bacterium]